MVATNAPPEATIAAPPDGARPDEGAAAVTVGELLVGGLMVAVVVVAEVSLALAHARSWRLGAVAVLSVAVLAVLAVVAIRVGSRPAVRVAPAQLAVVAGTAAVCGLLFFPGFPAAMAGWDPGVYVAHGMAVPRTGAWDVADPVMAVDEPLPGLGADRFPALVGEAVEADRSTPGFYHLYTALLAPAADIAGETGLVTVNPLVGTLATLGVLLVGWRSFGPLAGVVAGGLAATNVIWAWHARLPTSEMLTVMLVVAATLGVAVAVRTGWRFPAGLAGLFVGATFLARGDGMILVVLVAAGFGALAVAGRFDARATWGAVGLAVLLPHGFQQAFHYAENYTLSQGLFPPHVLLAGILVPAVVGATALGLRRIGRTPLQAVFRRLDAVCAWAAGPSGRPVVGGVVVVAFGLVLAVNAVRPWFSDAVLPPPGTDLDAEAAYYAPRSLRRLSWFLTPWAIVAAWFGLAVLALRRWRLDRWVAVSPMLVLLPVYLYDPRINSRLIWWTRRFLPYSLLGFLLLVALAVAAGMRWRGRLAVVVRPVAAAVGALILGAQLSMTLPLVDHHELAGSLEIHQDVAALAPEGEALFLWSQHYVGGLGTAEAFASTLLYRTGAPVARLPADAGPDEVAAWRDAFPDLPAYLVVDGTELPESLGDLDAEPVRTVHRHMPLWELTFDARPTEATTMRAHFTIWRLGG